jgi:hypothetical protein
MNRRSFLGGLSVMGASLPCLNAAEAIVSDPRRKAKSVIYLFMGGGLSQYESFNVDFDKDVLGKSEPIPTNVDGKRISHYMPNMAKQMDKCMVLSTVVTNQGAHPAAIYKALTGYNPRSSITHPELGAWVNRFKSAPADTLPNFVSINSRRAGTAGFFPGQYAALPVVDPNAGIRYSSRHKRVNEATFEKRLNILAALNADFAKDVKSPDTQAYLDTYRDSVKFMTSRDLEAFDLKKEHGAITKLYANDKFGRGCLLAGRLVERGVKFVKVELGGWDYHQQLYTDLPSNANKLDKGLSALLMHLSQKGLLDSTLVVLATEFGRKPDFNPNAGRDHHPKGFTCMLAGAGVKGGETFGKMDSDGVGIEENPVDITDFNATIAWSLGMDPTREVMSPSGRPFSIDNKKGKPQAQLFG